MVRAVVLASLLAVAAGRPVLAKVLSPAPTAAADKTVQRMAPPLGCDRLSIAEGLPNTNVHAIVQDRSGFIWFGTQDGLVRYDGIKMRVYRPIEKDPTSISSS